MGEILPIVVFCAVAALVLILFPNQIFDFAENSIRKTTKGGKWMFTWGLLWLLGVAVVVAPLVLLFAVLKWAFVFLF